MIKPARKFRKLRTELVKAGVSPELKRKVREEADRRGETEAVVIRDALIEWFGKHRPKAGG